MKYLICAVIGYLLGCFNTAFFISKAKGFDIRDKGTGNAGASNIKLSLGWGYAVLTALCDIFKAFAAVLIARYLYPDDAFVQCLAGCMAVVGHIFPFYMHFRGGKGYACYAGMLLGLNWKLALAAMAFGIIVTLVTDYIAIATISTVVLIPLHFAMNDAPLESVLVLCAVALLVIFKHRTNIKKIISHEEIGLRKSGKKSS